MSLALVASVVVSTPSSSSYAVLLPYRCVRVYACAHVHMYVGARECVLSCKVVSVAAGPRRLGRARGGR